MRTMVLGGLAATVLASPASALTYLTYTGVAGGQSTYSIAVDHTGVFTAPGTDLRGMPFKARFRIDENVPGAIHLGSGGESLYDAGSAVGSPSAFDTSLTINGRTRSFSGSYIGQIFARDWYQGVSCYQCADDLEVKVQSGVDQIEFRNLTLASNMLSSGLFRTPLDYTVTEFRGAVAAFDLRDGGITGAEGELTATRIIISSTVPEPGVWVLMIAGFGLTGAALRRRIAYTRAAATAAISASIRTTEAPTAGLMAVFISPMSASPAAVSTNPRPGYC